jgi:hypothetical protein
MNDEKRKQILSMAQTLSATIESSGIDAVGNNQAIKVVEMIKEICAYIEGTIFVSGLRLTAKDGSVYVVNDDVGNGAGLLVRMVDSPTGYELAIMPRASNSFAFKVQ